ncbi:hypothetical protein HpSP79_17460 [Helicobacter pylori]
MIDDIRDFDSEKDPKYLRKIYIYLAQNRRRIAKFGMPRLVKFEYNSAKWRIGWMIYGDFTGCSIHFGKKIEEYCYPNIAEKDILAEVDWETYRRIGSCAFGDYWHKWQRINRNWRMCIHCRQMQRRKVVTVKTIERREIFENV